MTGVADVYALVAARLGVMFEPLDAWTAWTDGPPEATGMPAVWAELVAGGGVNFDLAALLPLTIRVVAVPAPQATPVQHAAMADVVDTLDAGFRPALAPGVAYDGRPTWRLDTVELGGATYDAVLYDLTLAFHPTC